MIRIRTSLGRITATGHAGYARRGEDIVCSAVSILLYTLAAALGDEATDLQMEEGNSRIEWKINKKNNRTQDVILEGFRLLAGTYPQYVDYQDNRV